MCIHTLTVVIPMSVSCRATSNADKSIKSNVLALNNSVISIQKKKKERNINTHGMTEQHTHFIISITHIKHYTHIHT
jgi:hypothetical protein